MPKTRISKINGAPEQLPRVRRLSSPASCRLFNCAGLTAALGLVSLPAFLTLAPLFSSPGVSATENNSGSGNVGVEIGAGLAVSAEDITISTTPTVGNTFITTTSTVNVKNTGADGGYHLIMSSQNNGSLKTSNNNGGNSYAINTISGYSKTGSEMRNASSSSWGYTMEEVKGTNQSPVEDDSTDINKTYLPIPTTSTSWNETADEHENRYAYLKNTTEYTNIEDGDNIIVGYAFAIGPSTTAGTYTDTITYTAIPNTVTKPTIFSLSTMQDLATYEDACLNTPTPSVTAAVDTTRLVGYKVGQKNIDKIPAKILTDTRDGSTYKVKKLADGNCWMTDSLALAGEDETHPITLTSADSNVTTDFELPAAVVASATTNDNTKAYVSNGGVNGTYLYNFYAATAGSGSSISSGNAPQDICPKGWHLPNKEGDASWNRLLRVGQGVYEIATNSNGYSSSKVSWGSYAGFSTAASNPVGLQFTGVFWDSKLQFPAGGSYWTRTAESADNAHNLGYNSSDVIPQGDGNKGYGFGVRCVADGEGKEFMQEWTGCSDLPEGNTVTLYDKRDGKDYTVTKINHSDSDSLCWMTQNLNLAGGTKVTSADSHVTEDYTLPNSATSGFSDNNTAYVYNTPDPDSNGYGGYYSWITATAGTGTTSVTSGNTSADICPKGWRLPTKDEFDALKSYKNWNNSSAWTAAPFNGKLAGSYDDSSPYDVGSNGYYWSSTAVDDAYAYRLCYYSSGADTGYSNKRLGRSVRCVFGS